MAPSKEGIQPKRRYITSKVLKLATHK